MGAEVAYEEAQARKANARAEAAVRRGDDERARAALRRRHDAVDAAQLFTQQLDAQQQMVERLKAQLRQVDSKLRHMRQERDSLVARKRLADAQLAMATSMQQLNGNGIESELTRLGRSVRVTEAHASAAAELSAYTLDGRLDPGDDEQVEAQLRALKQQVGQLPMLPRDPVRFWSKGATTAMKNTAISNLDGRVTNNPPYADNLRARRIANDGISARNPAVDPSTSSQRASTTRARWTQACSSIGCRHMRCLAIFPPSSGDLPISKPSTGLYRTAPVSSR